MAQEKTSSKSDRDQPRDEDGRFTEKSEQGKSSGNPGGSPRSSGDRKSSGGAKDDKSSGDQRSNSR